MSFNTALIGGVGGAIIGFFAGGTGDAALQGLQYGTFVGALFDQAKTPVVNGPRVSDLTLQTSTYGAPIPRAYGTVALCGNIFWLENNKMKEVAKKNKSGGKGGSSSSSYVTYTYFGTFAVGLCKGPIVGVRRIWINKKLFYNANTTDLSTLVASNGSSKYFTVHTGTETQNSDARMQATLGVANTPAYRGLAYLVFKDLPLKDYGNCLASTQIKVEVIYTGSVSSTSNVITYGTLASGDNYMNGSFVGDTLTVGKVSVEGSDYILTTKTVTQYGQSGGKAIAISPWVGLNGSYVLRSPAGAIGVIYNYSSDPSHAFKIYDLKGSLVDTFNPADTSLGSSATHGLCASIGGLSYLPIGSNGVAIFKSGGLYADIPVSGLPGGVAPLQIFTDESSNVYINNGYGIYRCNPKTLAVLESFPFSSYTNTYNFRYRQNGCFYSANDTSKVVTRLEYTGGAFVTKSASNTGYGPFAPVVGDLVFGYGAVFNFADTSTSTAVPMSTIVSTEALQSDFLESADIDVTLLSSQSVRGFMVSSVAAIRSALAPLQGTYPFDILQSGYKIKFKPRGTSSVVTIPKDDLAAVTLT